MSGSSPLGPSFGVRSWDLRESISMAWQTRRAMPAELDRRRNRLFVDQYRNRLPDRSYRPATSDPDFVLFAAWPWTLIGKPVNGQSLRSSYLASSIGNAHLTWGTPDEDVGHAELPRLGRHHPVRWTGGTQPTHGPRVIPETANAA